MSDSKPTNSTFLSRPGPQIDQTKIRRGKPCKRCGGAERYISTGGCAPCARELVSLRLRDAREIVRGQKSRTYFRNKNGYVLRGNLKMYGLTTEEYAAMLSAQGGVCAICGGQDEGRRLGVDHDHASGKIRGLLCVNCNRGLGSLRDNPELVRKALQYLEGDSGE